jgi:hypothetical protein
MSLVSLDNDEALKFKAESQIVVFFMRLRSWTWNAECNHTSITSHFIPSIVPLTRSFHLHLNHYVSRQDFRRPELRLLARVTSENRGCSVIPHYVCVPVRRKHTFQTSSCSSRNSCFVRGFIPLKMLHPSAPNGSKIKKLLFPTECMRFLRLAR